MNLLLLKPIAPFKNHHKFSNLKKKQEIINNIPKKISIFLFNYNYQ